MESAQALRPTTNPYIVQLVRSLRSEPGLEVELFSFGRAIFGHFDVFHVHWPETLITANNPVKRWRRRVLTLLFALRLLLFRKPVVRTWHNLDRPEGLSRFDYFLLDLFDRATTLRIILNPLSELPDDKAAALIPHGHYRDWYRAEPDDEAIAGRVGYVGLIRRYKGVETLLQAFRGLADERASLHVAGKPSNPELIQQLTDLAADDPRISFDLHFLDDEEFTANIRRSSIVALPYHHMHNSGTVLAVLSLDRPALVPDNPMNRSLATEVGGGWLYYFEDELTTEALSEALQAVTQTPPQGRPNLDARGWPESGRAHADAFRRAISLRRAG